MPLNAARTRQYLHNFDFATLFREELGWERYAERLDVAVDNQTFTLSAVAQKRGLVAYKCDPLPDGSIPDYKTRRKIERKVAKSAHEHLIVFTDAANTTQIWQWVRREPGRPAACREHTYSRTQPGDALIQKLDAIAFSLDEEERLTIVEVAGRTRAAFDLERVTRRFYDRFKTEHTAFLKFITGIEAQTDREWYASLMLNRLMFVYFIQKKSFLDGDPDYLRNRMRAMQARNGAGKFLSFYRHFLLRLFHQGLGQAGRDTELDTLLGKVPYLNGGLFDVHELERDNPDITIPDDAFTAIFDFFDAYQWHLDERPLRDDSEINPDVLGYIFEKYINQKQMGAYYTKEDITEYISKNTIIPYLFDAARPKCRTAFEGEQSVWRALQDDPDRYIHTAVKKGVGLALPADIAAGVADVSQRGGWNRPADAEYALPTEIWREVVARRKRYEETWLKLAGGEVHDINDLITMNVDIRQFARDVIENADGPELKAFWESIEGVTVLDPTCGSGAFLFAALNILEDLYDACLDRMERLIDEWDRQQETEPDVPNRPRHDKYPTFRAVLRRVDDHHNRAYFILKNIILNNLYGVDIMDEAVEICKLRLFLKLVAQVESVDQVEPLPDIDFNIRAGNTLIGFATEAEVDRAFDTNMNLKFGASKEQFKESVEIAAQAYAKFREMQTAHGMDSTAFSAAKRELRERLNTLNDELDKYLALQYGKNPAETSPFTSWKKSHQPLHWFVEFYSIIVDGGFAAIIGNPPYVEYSKIRQQYELHGYSTLSCGNLYANVIERCLTISRPQSRNGMIVQLPIVCTDRMMPLQNLINRASSRTWFSTYDDRPARLFDGLEHIRATIFILEVGTDEKNTWTTRYTRWLTEARSSLFSNLVYAPEIEWQYNGAIPKIGDIVSGQISTRINGLAPLGVEFGGSCKIYFHNAPQYWIRAMTFIPYFWNERGGEQLSTQVKTLHLPNPLDASVVAAVLNSSLFYWWFILLSDCRHLNMREIERFPLRLQGMEEGLKRRLRETCEELMVDYQENSSRKDAYYKATGRVVYDEYYPRHSKHIIDKIDRVLAQHYGFTDQELDFIINYDIKYRMGRGAESEDGDNE